MEDEVFFQAFLELIGSNLPELYIDSLRLDGVASVSGLQVLVIQNKKGETIDEVIIRTFYKLEADEYYLDLKGHFLMFRDRIGNNLIPIASDVFGNQVCISIDKNNFGTVYFWYHDTFEDDPDALAFLANDFSEFLGKLTPYKEPEIDDSNLDELTRMVRRGQLENVVNFIKKGGDINYKNKFNHNLLEEAINSRQFLIAKYLIQSGISMKNVLVSSTSQLDQGLLAFMLKYGADPNDTFEETGYSALIIAVRENNREIVRSLVSAGAILDKSNPVWKDVINQIIWGKQKQVLELLK